MGRYNSLQFYQWIHKMSRTETEFYMQFHFHESLLNSIKLHKRPWSSTESHENLLHGGGLRISSNFEDLPENVTHRNVYRDVQIISNAWYILHNPWERLILNFTYGEWSRAAWLQTCDRLTTFRVDCHCTRCTAIPIRFIFGFIIRLIFARLAFRALSLAFEVVRPCIGRTPTFLGILNTE